MRKLNHTTLLFPLAAAFALSSPAAFAQSHGAGVNATAAARVPAQLPAQASAGAEIRPLRITFSSRMAKAASMTWPALAS